jgi:hypothetical protein
MKCTGGRTDKVGPIVGWIFSIHASGFVCHSFVYVVRIQNENRLIISTLGGISMSRRVMEVLHI